MTISAFPRMLAAAVLTCAGLAAPATQAAQLPELRYLPSDVAVLLDGSRDEESTRLAISSESKSLPLDKVDTSWQTE